MKLSFNKKTLDNITIVMIAFEGLESYFQSQVKIKTADGRPTHIDSQK